MTQKLGIEEDKVQELCLSLYKIYGTTMAGLKVSSFSHIIPYLPMLIMHMPIISDVHSFRLWVMTLITTISIGTELSSSFTVALYVF